MRYFATFGSNHLTGFFVRPTRVMLGIEGASEEQLRAVLRQEPFGNRYCTTYPISMAKDMENKWGMKLYSLKELLSKEIK